MSPIRGIGSTATDLWRRPLGVLLLAYGLCILCSTLLPFQFTLHPEALSKTGTMSRSFVQRVSGWPAPLTDLFGNIVLFLPLGALAYGAHIRSLPGRPGRAVALASFEGLLLSLGVETLQYFTPVRETATSDLVWNTCGAFLGAAVAARCPPRLSTSRLGQWIFWSRTDTSMMAVGGMTTIVLLRALVPFDVSIQPVVLMRAVRLAQLDPRRDPASLAHLVDHALLYALLAGSVYQVARRGRNALRGLRWSLGITLVLAILEEGVHLVIKSRMIATLDVVAAMIGGTGGTLWMLCVGRTGYGVIAAYLATLTVSTLHLWGAGALPDVMQERLTVLLPVHGRYFENTLAGITESMHLLLFYAPLGFLTATRLLANAAWGPPRRSLLVATAGAGFSALLEILQLAVPAGEVKLGHAIPAFLGAGLGALAWACRNPVDSPAS